VAARCGYERVPKVTEAKAIGLELRDTTVVILGSPQAGTPVMVAAALVALDLPCKVLVWADGCETKVSYTAPGCRVQISRHLTQAELVVSYHARRSWSSPASMAASASSSI